SLFLSILVSPLSFSPFSSLLSLSVCLCRSHPGLFLCLSLSLSVSLSLSLFLSLSLSLSRVLAKVIPDVHLSTEGAHLDDGLTQEVVRLSLEALLHPRLDVIILVPHM